ncbi:hypothetical protein SDC9_182365 [bioreactor metagenome]|uniref:Uncharacterized protein n=1 Tax=bioreactor metagenome TaxID=1076179 RepID=A0A645H773_9ZZZZ
MHEPVLCLVGILGDQVVMGSVAVVAGRYVGVAASHPTLVLLIHRMAAGTGRRVVPEVLGESGVVHGEQPDPEDHANQGGQANARPTGEHPRETVPEAFQQRHRVHLPTAVSSSSWVRGCRDGASVRHHDRSRSF